ncbi:Hypothetical protein CINCED_3A013547 [Cinara cedri]|uniref:Uncharacterized protein n=1 Tax=Cinara cedri TaxID=506608 RepID=A0A5E4MLJ4_9HEMI|nr:Hypothetical protein CINCED_3A013547 [Cinara cedri]
MKSFTVISIVCFLVFTGSARCAPGLTAAAVIASENGHRVIPVNSLDGHDSVEYLFVESNYFKTSEKPISEPVDTTEDFTETYTL